MILYNITAYRKKFNQDEQQYIKLKKLAGENNELESDPLDDDGYVVKRCKQVLNVGVNKVLNKMSKKHNNHRTSSLSAIESERFYLCKDNGIYILLYLL